MFECFELKVPDIVWFTSVARKKNLHIMSVDIDHFHLYDRHSAYLIAVSSFNASTEFHVVVLQLSNKAKKEIFFQFSTQRLRKIFIPCNMVSLTMQAVLVH